MSENITAITLSLSSNNYWIIGLILAIVLTIIASWVKSSIVFLGALICWVGAYLELPMSNTYYNVGMGLMILYCISAGFFRFQQKRSGRG